MAFSRVLMVLVLSGAASGSILRGAGVEEANATRGSASPSTRAADDRSTSSCSLPAEVDVIVFVDADAGSGEYSSQWETTFWKDWVATRVNASTAADHRTQAANHTATAPSHAVLDLKAFGACSAEDLQQAKAFVVPGGDAYDYTQALGSDGKAKIAQFVSNGGLYIGTCAGFYYASQAYYWEFDTQWPDAARPDKGYWQYPDALGIFQADVEGSIADIADEETAPGVFDGNAVTELYLPDQPSHRVVYYGGPTLGWRHTSEDDLPPGADVLARYTAVTGSPPAIVRLQAPHLLLFSPHLEAVEGVGQDELTHAEREANYALRRKLILAELA